MLLLDNVLARTGVPVQWIKPGIASIALENAGCPLLPTQIAEALPPAALAGMWGAVVPAALEPNTPYQPFPTTPLVALVKQMQERERCEWVRETLDTGSLFSVFQPIVDTHGNVFGYEALMRARDVRTGAVIGAGTLMEACQTLELQHVLDQRARGAALHSAARNGLRQGRLFINFLPNTIYDPRICLQTTWEAAVAHEIEPSRLVFEVVETEQIPDLARLKRILDYYRSCGAATAIDDMGAGFSSLRYIEELRPNFVKVDREIVAGAVHNETTCARFAAIIAGARSVGACVVAEGIETEAQMAVSLSLGVDLLQGHLFAEAAATPGPIHSTVFNP